MKNQLFNRYEIQEIIKRASILQNENEQPLNEELDGLSKQEIRQICKEAGIAPKHTDFAIHEVLSKNFYKKSGYTNTTIYDFIHVSTSITDEECWKIVSYELMYHIPKNIHYKIFSSPETGKWSYKDILNKQIAARIESFDGGFFIKLTEHISDFDPVNKSLNISGFLSIAIVGFIFTNYSIGLIPALVLLLIVFSILSLFSYKFEIERRKNKLSKLKEIGTILGEAIPES